MIVPTINTPDITLTECTERYQLGVDTEKTGQLIQGQALAFAKEIVALPNGGTWKAYCEEIGISAQRASLVINLYKAHKSFALDTETQEIYVEPTLPTAAEKLDKLKGSTPQEKATNYTEIRTSLAKAQPTVKEIKEHNAINDIEVAVTTQNKIKKSLRNSSIQTDENLKEILNEEPTLHISNNIVSPVLDIVEAYVIANESLYEGALCDFRIITLADGTRARIGLNPTITFL